MQKSQFTSNYTGIFNRGNYLHRELLALIEHAEMHPQTAAQLLAQFQKDAALVLDHLTAAGLRTSSSGPNAQPHTPADLDTDDNPLTPA